MTDHDDRPAWLCPHSDHRAPDPADQPTSCDCGLVTRYPAPVKETP